MRRPVVARRYAVAGWLVLAGVSAVVVVIVGSVWFAVLHFVVKFW